MAGSFYTQDVFAWYGFLGLPIVISIILTIFYGRDFLKIVAVTIAIYALIVTFAMPWAPWNGRFFAVVFAGGMACFGFMLKWITEKTPHVSKWMVNCALLIAAGNLIFQVGYVNITQMTGLKREAENRDIVYSRPFSQEGWDFFVKKIPPDSKVLLISATNFPIFPLLLRRPDLNFTLTGKSFAGGKFIDGVFRESFRLNGINYDLHHIQAKEFKTIEKYYDKIFILGLSKVL